MRQSVSVALSGIVFTNIQCVRFALERSAPERSAPERSALERRTPESLAPERSALERFAQERRATQRFASERSGSTSKPACVLQEFQASSPCLRMLRCDSSAIWVSFLRELPLSQLYT